jgi:sugar phosphate isomerase/epimerase
MNRLGVERLSVFGMPPVEFVELAADLGCGWVGMGLSPSGSFNPHGYRGWSLRDDAALRRETRAALAGTGVRIGILEGFAVIPGQDPHAFERDLDLLVELGGNRINVVSLDKDLHRTIEGFAIFADMASQRGLQVSAEMGSLGPIGQIETALATVRGVGMDNFTLLIDAMHLFRLGNTVEQLASLPSGVIGYAQLCDAPWAPRFATYMEEAMYERMAPGEGELPLDEFVRCLPADIIVSLEIPMRSLAEKGVGPRERLMPSVVAARSLLQWGSIDSN